MSSLTLPLPRRPLAAPSQGRTDQVPVPPTPQSRHRADIQGLRALAVALVVWYHVWPQSLPGGFVGVDVFFVISGYLIVGSLARELVSTGTLRLARFYSRRVRRLLPAAAAVLLATTAATVLMFPQNRWQGVARDVAASGLNVQNWNQAFSTASYEGATGSVSPLQHFWSLSVEEQFYLFIPLVLLFCLRPLRSSDAARTRRRHRLLVALAVLTGVSFLHSVLFSASSAELAYFFTTTRIWELGLGGLLAVLVPALHWRPGAVAVLGWAGLLMVLVAAVTFSTDMAFPGWVAILPVAGAMALLAAGSSPAPQSYRMAARWQSLRPVTYAGDISYSLYLWHWPVIVFSVFKLGPSPGWLHGGAVIAGSAVLAALSTRWIEKPFRRFEPVRSGGRARARGRRRAATPDYRSVFVLGALLAVVPVAVASVPYLVIESKQQALASELDLTAYPGAMAVQDGVVRPVDPRPVRPDPAVATADQPGASDECRGAYNPADVDYEDCVFGAEGSSRSIVLVGDSHAGQYMDSLGILARESGYRLYVLTRNGCPFSVVPLASETRTYTNCSGQNEQTIRDILAINPALVVTASLSPAGYEEALGWRWENDALAVSGFTDALAPLAEAGIKVAAISDVPFPPFNVPECVAADRAGSCSFDPPRGAGPLEAAAAVVDGAAVVDLRGYFCPEGACRAVIGNVLVYRDNHITGTFAKTLAIPLQESLGL